jgi:hypothetical protein
MIYIWVRATLDWRDEDAFWAQVRPDFRSKVALWNATFNIPFHLFRHRVRQIAALNLSKVEGSVCVDWEQIPDGALVVPVDDDDWLAPSLANVLDRERECEPGAYWSSSWIGVPWHFGHRVYLTRRRLLPFTPVKWICETNNYALLKGPGTKPLFDSHMRATDWYEGPGRGVVKKIDQRLSVINRTLAAQTSLRTKRGETTRSRLLFRFRRYKKLYNRPRPADPAWCRPYVAMMSDLMDELEVRR